jgi:hypothetical protein
MALEGSVRTKTPSRVRSRLVGPREGIIEVLFRREGKTEDQQSRVTLDSHGMRGNMTLIGTFEAVAVAAVLKGV